MGARLSEIARTVNLDINLVRDILTEKPGIKATKEMLDLVFKTARQKGYDFKKLKIGKRMNLRLKVIKNVIEQIEANPNWKRKEILDYMKNLCKMVKRVHQQTFQEEFGDE